MYRGYRNILFYKNLTNKSVTSLNHISKCSKCLKLNPILHSPALNNIQTCMYWGNPFYIVKLEK